MNVTLTAADMVSFEDAIADDFLNKTIKAPIHLAGGNERQLISIFEEHVHEDDWLVGGWRSHYHCLLKGVPPDELRAAIHRGHSISLSFPEQRILCSGIVGGMAPIAVGIADGIKRKNEGRKVVAFLGDMSAESGIVMEAIKYSVNFRLPVLWVIEDNGKSVGTNTAQAWGGSCGMMTDPDEPQIIRYQYTLTRPHVGIGQFVHF